MADSTTTDLSYDLLIGPLLVGTLMDTVVFGLCFMQAARYMLLDFKDGWQIRCENPSPAHPAIGHTDMCMRCAL